VVAVEVLVTALEVEAVVLADTAQVLERLAVVQVQNLL
jgi:hypothetical protein